MNAEKVAVITVHGVGNPPAGDTSNRVMRQLQHHDPRRSGHFACTPVHIAVDTADLDCPPAPGRVSRNRAKAVLMGMDARARTATPATQGKRSADLAFTAMTLAGGESFRSSYATTMLRADGPGGGRLDIYEMFWADLSHVGSGSALKVLQQMLQLFLHMASLGRTALATQLANWPAASQPPAAMSAAYAAAAASYWLLAVPILLGNVLLLCYGVAFLGLLVPDNGAGREGTALALAIGIGTLLGVALRALLRRPALPSWLAKAGLAPVWLGAAGCAARAPRGTPARRSITTAFVAAALPAPLLLFAVLAFWRAALSAIEKTSAGILCAPVHSGVLHGKSQTFSAWIQWLLELSASPGAVPYLILLVLAFACVLIAIVPSVLAEASPPPRPVHPAASRGLWRWLDSGYRLMGLAKWLAVAGFFFVLPVGAILQYNDNVPQWLTNLGLSGFNVAVGGGALALATLPRLLGGISFGRISRALAQVRVVIDTAIDVDNWLRERPVGDTPRLHIMARYASLLRHVRDKGYDRVVLVCHSQGAVITLDLLRYLKGNDSTLLRQLKRIDLLTFGAPIRQLYAARFPAIYGWAEQPDPAAAGLASWRNGYGSGDYVGRALWSGPASKPWKPGRNGTREFCTGALAHTRYFDRVSPAVARAIAGLC